MPIRPPSLAPGLQDRIAADGETLIVASGAVSIFDNPGAVWFIHDGGIELFAVQRKDGAPTGPRQHLGSLPAGGMIWGIAQHPDQDGIHLLAMANGDCRLSRVTVAAVDKWGFVTTLAEPLAASVDLWIGALSRGVSKSIAPRNLPRRSLSPGQDMNVTASDRIVSHRGVTWARLDNGVGFYMDVIKVIGSAERSALVPLTPQGWLRADTIRTLRGKATADLVRRRPLGDWMNSFHEWILQGLAFGFRDATSLENARLTHRAAQLVRDTQTTFFGFARLLDAAIRRSVPPEGEDALFECCAAIGKAMDIAIIRPSFIKWRRIEDPEISVADIAAASQLRVRPVTLPPDWWKNENGPLLAFRQESGEPVALLQKSPSVTLLFDPGTTSEQVLTEDTARTLAPVAHCFYAALPDRPVGPMDLVRLCLRQCKADLTAIILTGALGGLIATAIPLSTGYVFDTIIPGHQSMEMLQIGAAIVSAAFAAAAFEISRNIAQLRIEGRISGIAQAAIMDRLLRLPTDFFADYSSGDLAQRAMVVETARKSLTGIVTGSLVSGAFSVFSFGLLIYYVPIAALVTVVLCLVLAVATLITGSWLMSVTAGVQEISGRISGQLLEIITGIAKLRGAGAEQRAFNNWGENFNKLQAGEILSRRIHNRFSVFWAAFEVISLGTIFAVIGLIGPTGLTTGAFLAFIAAFSGLTASIFALAKSVITVFSVVPLYRRAAPILNTVPETNTAKAASGPLSGELEVNAVFFRYSANAPFVLNGLSLKVSPGELIAVVGPSGSGKSTLMRLLLGIGHPESGAIYFGGRDLRGLNLRSVRRQIGVVMQNGRLMPGSIYENIKGSTRASMDECWDTAAQVGLADDILAMPMGMHTVLTEGTSTLSGGQIQRLLIARALIGKPALLLLDEATSALDNETQAVVMRSLDHLSVTRIVIAHRLSTIINADRIFVLKDGRIAETGSYQQLMEKDGIFTTLAYRQSL